jgi:dipeptidyl-peptidase 4
MKRYIFLLISFLVANHSIAQSKLFTIEDATYGIFRQFAPDDLENLQWIGNSDRFSYIENISLMENVAGSASQKEILTLADLNALLHETGINALNYFPEITWCNNNSFSFIIYDRLLVYNVDSKKIDINIPFDVLGLNQDFSFEAKAIAFTAANNVFIEKSGGNIEAITNDKDKNIVNGQFVSRNEFGINKGTFWSPKGNYLAFYRKDESDVANYPVVDVTQKPAGIRAIRYPMAGMKSEHVSLGIYSMANHSVVYIERDSLSEQYLTNISWAPDEKSIYIIVLNRGQDHGWINKYDISTGRLVKTLFEEKNNKYFEPLNPLVFLNNKKDEFLYQSRSDGYNHIYLYNTEGKLIKQVTSGKWEVTKMLGTDPKDRYVFFESTRESPIERHLYKVEINSGTLTKLTLEPGTHFGVISPSGKYLIDKYNNVNIPNQIDLIETVNLQKANILKSDNPIKDYQLGKKVISTIRSNDGKTDLYYRMVRPVGFDSLKKYPVIVYVYGGPHDQLVHNAWLEHIELWQQYMAQKGYISFTLDNRGSANRGLEFENIIHRQVGTAEMEDQMKGVKFLKSLTYTDTSKFGIYGWSFGGYMSLSLMLHYPGVFKVAIAGAPVTDWGMYEVMYGERYMDKPQENPDGYRKTNLSNYASELKGKLLIIQGDQDSTVVWQQSLCFLKSCISSRVFPDYFVYPKQDHRVGGQDRIHLMEKITRYFDENL